MIRNIEDSLADRRDRFPGAGGYGGFPSQPKRAASKLPMPSDAGGETADGAFTTGAADDKIVGK